jgi:hypothetical protein
MSEKNKNRPEYREEGILYLNVILCFVLVAYGIGRLCNYVHKHMDCM